jgi:NAD(P)-dependent dehydrogenase (short-subunit alcohol dehydrogenase family)
MAEFKGFDKNFGLSGKTALVTGSAKGIGKAIALMFAEKGADIILVDMDPGIKEVSGEIKKMGRNAIEFICDISLTENIDKIVKESILTFSKIDLLVNSAGVALVDDAEKITEDIWDKTMSVNLKALFILSQAAGKEMIKQGKGKIINIASIAGPIAFEKHAAYTTSKAGVIGLTKSMALEWAKYGINVNSISPVVTLTEMGKSVWVGELGETMKKKIPVGRFNDPSEIAAVALFLASDATNMITGQNIIIDGGYSIQ